MLKSDSRTRALVGRVCKPLGVFSLRPLAIPAMMRKTGASRDYSGAGTAMNPMVPGPACTPIVPPMREMTSRCN